MTGSAISRDCAASSITCRISASPRCGCCRSTPRRCATTATTSPTTRTSTRPTAGWPISRPSSARRTAAGCGSSPSWSSTTPRISIPGFSAPARAKPGSPLRDFYVWSDTDQKFPETRIIFLDTEKSNWTWDPVAQAYYWHRFYSHQPDLNFDNPRVFRAVANVMRFWLDLGVDGMRLDAVPYLIEREGTINENLPETHEVLRRLRARARQALRRPHAARRGQSMAGGRAAIFRRRRRMPHGVPLPADAAHLHGGRDRGPPPDHRHHAPDAGHSGDLPVGGVSAQPRRADARNGDRSRARLSVELLRRRPAGAASISASAAASRR